MSTLRKYYEYNPSVPPKWVTQLDCIFYDRNDARTSDHDELVAYWVDETEDLINFKEKYSFHLIF